MVIGTWNLQNLSRPGAGPGTPKDEAAYEAKLDGLASTVNRLDPVLLGVQEVLDPKALDDLVERLDGHWHVLLSEHPDRAPHHPIRVGFLSRRPMKRLADATAFPKRLLPVQSGDDGGTIHAMGRGVLAVEIEPAAGHRLTAAVCHLKSKLLKFPDAQHPGRDRFDTDDEGERARVGAYAIFRRGAEAAAVRALADKLLEGQGDTRDVAVLGDFNDGPKAATTQILYGPPGSQLDHPRGAARPDPGDAMRLWNLAPLIKENAFSRVFEGEKELIDHILVSHSVLARVKKVFTGAGEPLESTGEQPKAGKQPSDHAPVLAELAY
ncbi:endonuclease/exonuclease/phosphatase family protein [Streptomyces sp. NPDC049555]|uniref:endonuclease/exonuclease/phosphatase family protein n=1 Tax=Streptomyces sp. NPDC049555 TaxID=3154930 RepID=UPI00341BCB0E